MPHNGKTQADIPAAVATTDTETLPAMVRQAASRLACAVTAAQVLEAHELAGLTYDTAKRAARLNKAKHAHDDVVAACYRAQADALDIEAQAKRRLADEYDAAQERGEVAKAGEQDRVRDNLPNGKVIPATAKDLGLSYKQIHEARVIRDIEDADPGVVGRTAHAMAEDGREPTRAAVKRAVSGEAPAAPSGFTDARGRRMPERPLPECMDRGLDQLANTVDALSTLLARPDAYGHDQIPDWLDRMAKSRAAISRLINQHRGGKTE